MNPEHSGFKEETDVSIRYPHLLSPVQVGNVLFKNRMEATAATPHFVQGTEPYPTEKWITMMANRAKTAPPACTSTIWSTALPTRPASTSPGAFFHYGY